MKLLFTGASGFLGTNLLPFFRKDFNVTTLGFSKSNDIFCDLSETIPNLEDSFDIVFHAAGKAHSIPKSEEEKQMMMKINFDGTKHLCHALKTQPPKSFVFVSTVAVYGVENGLNIDEDHPLSGNTPYAISKIKAEQFLIQWCKENNVILSIIRPALIAGKNAPGNFKSMIQAIHKGYYLSIGKGIARKSILQVEDIAYVFPKLIKKGGIYNLCDSHHPTFRELENLLAKQLNKNPPISIPYWMAKILAHIGDIMGSRFPINSEKLEKITQSLTFSNEKAICELNWTPLDVLSNYKIK